jgi:superfamily II DNA or RNA helicase
MTLHAFNKRILAEDLMRVRRADDRERYAASQRQARIDPNPHQIDAVIFALRRLREGGCILADEVGLGKTIEAGLVIAQSRAEGAQRVLLIVPKSLIGQWQNELANLFAIQAQDNHSNFVAPGVYLVGREFAGSERGSAALGSVPPFDLVVIDEAHEIFRRGLDGSPRPRPSPLFTCLTTHCDANAELPRGTVGPGSVRGANWNASGRYRNFSEGFLLRRRSDARSRAGA